MSDGEEQPPRRYPIFPFHLRRGEVSLPCPNQRRGQRRATGRQQRL